MTIVFIAGTDTGVGKTYCAARWLETRRAAGRRVAAYKPVASGCHWDDTTGQWVSEDAMELWTAAGQPGPLHDVCPQRFAAAASPPVAAAMSNQSIDESLLLSGIEPWLSGGYDDLLIEGAGGLFSPISSTWLNIDLVGLLRQRLPELRLLLVSLNRLGVQHQVISTCRAAASSGCPVDEIWLNARDVDESSDTNAEQIRRYCNVPIR